MKSDNGQVLNMEHNDSPQPTPKTLLDNNVANNSIPENFENVNTGERNSKKATDKGVTLDDLNTNIHVLPEDNSDIRVHPPKPKNIVK